MRLTFEQRERRPRLHALQQRTFMLDASIARE
jgi:hypothetical protein